MPAAPGDGGGGRVEGGAPGAGGSGSGSGWGWGWGSSSGPAPVTRRATLLLRCPARCPNGPVPAAARPPRRLLGHQLGGRLLHLLRLDGGLPTAGDCGDGGSRRCPGTVGPGDSRDVHAGLLEDLAQRAAWLLPRGYSLLGRLRLCLLHLPGTGHHPAPESQRPNQLLPLLRLELHLLQVGLPPQPLRPPLPGRLR